MESRINHNRKQHNPHFITKNDALWFSFITKDFVIPYKRMLIPIEVKSGHNAKLRSLHQFMDRTPHDIAVRIWSNSFSIDEASTTNGKKFRLLNVPFYYVCVLERVLDKYV